VLLNDGPDTHTLASSLLLGFLLLGFRYAHKHWDLIYCQQWMNEHPACCALTTTLFRFLKVCMKHQSQPHSCKIQKKPRNNWSLTAASAYPPPPHLPTETPPPINPTLAIIQPASQAQHTHVLKSPLRQLIIPPILHFRDLLALGKDLHLTRDRLLCA
jgi:hypothetical protein